MVKNSWGDYGNYHGIWYLSKSFVAMYTTYIFLNKHALDKHLLDKMAVRF
jgi:aminopeptidase C